jgi:hypothetical protein
MDDRHIFINAPEGASPESLMRSVHEACRDDAMLRERDIALFTTDDEAERFMVNPTVAIETATVSGDLKDSVIGPYVLREKTGEGGFGAVYRAEQTTPMKESGSSGWPDHREFSIPRSHRDHRGAGTGEPRVSKRVALVFSQNRQPRTIT